MVTGVSTGSLIAPFAFLGSRYDDQLREVYMQLSAGRVFESRMLTAAMLNDAMAENTPLYKTISPVQDDLDLSERRDAERYREGL